MTERRLLRGQRKRCGANGFVFFRLHFFHPHALAKPLTCRTHRANLFTPYQLSDRLAREGIKTHKERVEELNKYLSNLSEHHDMPRIGPG